jgi:hypothetical protein
MSPPVPPSPGDVIFPAPLESHANPRFMVPKRVGAPFGAAASPARSCWAGLRPALALLLFLGVAGCGAAVRAADPVVDAEAFERDAQGRSALDRPYRLVFTWELVEPGVRLRGRGVARVEPPYRGRIDLFSSGGDRIGAATLLGDELRIPAGMVVALPPAPMLWGALGVYRPEPGRFAAEATQSAPGDGLLRYRHADGGSISVSFRQGRILQMERLRPGGASEEVRVRFGSEGGRFPAEAVYRDAAAVRELRVRMETVEHVESYPPDIWTPDA